jgi:hypothetical protein
MSLKTTARAYLRDAVTAFNRAPAEVALAVLSAVLVSYTIEAEYRFEAWLQMAVGIFIVFAFAWTGTLLHALGALDFKRRWVLTGAGAMVAAAYLLSIETLRYTSEMWRAFILAAGFALLALAAPAWMHNSDDASLRLRRINGRFILRALGIGLYGLALFGGLALALAAIDNLFELKLREQIYVHVLAWIMLVLVPWVIVGGLDSYVEPLERVSDVARVVHRLASFLVPPLIVLYYSILFVYALRIIGTGELPKNLVSPMVLAAGLLTAIALILFDPQPNDARTGHRVLRLAPALFIPLAPLGFWAITARTNEYGLTEFRLLRLIGLTLLLVLAVVGTLQLVRRRPFALRVIPALLGGVMILAVVGPWSVLRLSRRDQQGRLEQALREARVDPAGAVAVTTRRTIPRELYDRINNTGHYLQTHFGDKAVPLAADGFNLADRLGLAPAIGGDTLTQVVMGALAAGIPVATERGPVYRITRNNLNVERRDTLSVVPMMNGLVAEVTPLIQHLGTTSIRRRDQRPLPPTSLPVYDLQLQRAGDFVTLDAILMVKGSNVQFSRLEGVLILR